MLTDNNVIIIEGGAYSDIRKALKQWIELYSDYLESDFSFELYKKGRANHIIKADKKLDNEKFNYLVNYLKYPVDIDYQIKITGFTWINDTNIYPSDKVNKKIMIFIPENDIDYDIVLGITEDKDLFKISFEAGQKITNEGTGSYEEPDIDLSQLQYPEILTVETKKYSSADKESKENIKLEKRFRIITTVVLVLYFINFLFLRHNRHFLNINLMLSVSLMVWLHSDYKLLRIDKYYYRFLLLSLLILIYGFLIFSELSDMKVASIAVLGTLPPITFLIIQRVFRYIFKSIFKREPVIEKEAPFADLIYIILIFLTPYAAIFGILLLF